VLGLAAPGPDRLSAEGRDAEPPAEPFQLRIKSRDCAAQATVRGSGKHLTSFTLGKPLSMMS